MSIVNIQALKSNGCCLYWTGQVASSNSPKSISSFGDCKQILPFPGAGIGMFDGTGDYLAIPNSNDFNISANGSFTFRAWYYHISGSPAFIGTCPGTAATAGWIINVTSNILYFCATTGTQSWNICAIASSALTWATNTWYHIEVSLNAGMLYLFRDGILLTSSAMTSAISSSRALYIGYDGVQTVVYLNGYLAELQFINGVAGHTSNFTPPKHQLESDSNTKLLIHFNRNDTTFIDSSPSAHTITRYGDAKQLCSPCGSGVAYFDGTGDYLTVPDSDDWHFTTQNLTIEFWFKTNKTDTTNVMTFVSRNSSSGFVNTSQGSWSVLTPSATPGTPCLFWAQYANGTPTLQSTKTDCNDNQWHHLAIVRNGNNFTMYIDGNSVATATTPLSFTDTATPIYIGYDAYYTPRPMIGEMSDLRITVGIARYTANFTPQTTPFQPDPNTKLLLHMDGVGNAFYDSSDPPGDNGFPILPDGVTVTPSGTFAVEKMKDGRNIWKFDGSTNYITISDHASWSMFLNDFTIAGWVKFDSVAANKVIIGQYVDANNQWYLQWTTGNIIQLYGITSSIARFNFSCPLTAAANTWYHIAVQRSGSSCIMYINGVAQTVTQTTAFSATATDIAAVLSIGKINTGYQTGNIKDLQIFTKALTMDQVSALYQETFIY